MIRLASYFIHSFQCFVLAYGVSISFAHRNYLPILWLSNFKSGFVFSTELANTVADYSNTTFWCQYSWQGCSAPSPLNSSTIKQHLCTCNGVCHMHMVQFSKWCAHAHATHAVLMLRNPATMIASGYQYVLDGHERSWTNTTTVSELVSMWGAPPGELPSCTLPSNASSNESIYRLLHQLPMKQGVAIMAYMNCKIWFRHMITTFNRLPNSISSTYLLRMEDYSTDFDSTMEQLYNNIVHVSGDVNTLVQRSASFNVVKHPSQHSTHGDKTLVLQAITSNPDYCRVVGAYQTKFGYSPLQCKTNV